MWNGTTWSTVPVDWPTGLSILEGIGCTSATNCIAVGRNPSGTSQHTLTEQWNGTSWSIVSSPDSPGWSSNELRSVACSISADCWAVGDSGLAEHFDGVAWTVAAIPDNAPAPARQLYGVSCPSRTSCVAVGTTLALNDRRTTLTGQVTGPSWKLVNNGLASDSPHLLGVACPTDTGCVAVGSSTGSAQGPIPFQSDSDHVLPNGADPQAVAEHWNGTSWSL